MSGLGRFCCRSPLQAFLVSDSVAVMRFATGAGHDGAADSATGAEPARWLQFIPRERRSGLRPASKSCIARPSHCRVSGPDLTNTASLGSLYRRACPRTRPTIVRVPLCITSYPAAGLSLRMGRPSPGQQECRTLSARPGCTSGRIPATPRSSFFESGYFSRT